MHRFGVTGSFSPHPTLVRLACHSRDFGARPRRRSNPAPCPESQVTTSMTGVVVPLHQPSLHRSASWPHRARARTRPGRGHKCSARPAGARGHHWPGDTTSDRPGAATPGDRPGAAHGRRHWPGDTSSGVAATRRRGTTGRTGTHHGFTYALVDPSASCVIPGPGERGISARTMMARWPAGRPPDRSGTGR